MHAPPHPGPPVTGQRAAAALAALLIACLAGCSTGSSDPAALDTPSSSATTGSVATGAVSVTFAGNSPTVAGHPTATAVLARLAGTLPPGCVGTAERADQHLVSIAWHCGRRLAGATVTLDGRTLGLSDVLTGDYQQYLSSVASAQFAAEGVSGAGTDDLSTWYLTEAALAVAFPSGVVSYPLSSLAPYLRQPPSL